MTKLLSFASDREFKMDREIGMRLFWGGRLADRTDEEIRSVEELPQTEINFSAWFLFDMDLEDGKTVADFFLAREGARLSPGERAYLEKALQTHFRLYEVEAVEREHGFRLKDLWSGEIVQVRERAATHSFIQWDLMAARLMNVGDHWEIDAGCFNYPPGAKEPLLRALRKEHKRFQKNLPGQDDVICFKRIGIFFNHWWLDWVAFQPLPQIVTAEGNEFVFTRLIFEICDFVTVTAALDSRPELERDEDGIYAWLEMTPELRRHLGSLRLREGRLILETTSKERGERGRRLLERIAGEAIRYQVTEYQDVKQALKSSPKIEKPPPSGIPPELEERLMKDYLDKHYRSWLDEEIPALNYRTPMHAVTLKTWRPKVVDLLKEMENMEARGAERGKPRYDFGWVWKELGLDREKDGYA